MTHKFLPFFIMATAVFMLSSCLSDDDEDNTVYYDDTAISAFTLGNMAYQHHTTASDGVTDSIYYTTLNGSSYKFNIDQANALVYNTDSLPFGAITSHVLATISAVNSGTPILNLHSSTGSDSLAYYSSTDSIDFTNPVRVRIYNMRATAYREYTIKVNVHKETPEAFSWNENTVNGLETVTGRRIYTAQNGNTYLLGKRDGKTVIYQKTDAGWTEQNWETEPDFVELGATSRNAYLLRNDSILRKDVYGSTWVKDSLDDDADKLPNADANLIVKASKVNEGAYNLILIGNRDGKTVVWSKVEEADNATNPWAFYTSDTYNRKTLPYLANLRAVAYDDGILATGGDFTKVYFSQDNGLTWETNTKYALPESFGLSESPFAFGVDTNNIMYITKDGSNEIYSGRLARLGWSKEQTVFTRSAR